jgi:NAD(P)H-hydrate epimerase
MIEYSEIAVLDRNALHLGIPTINLMEAAGSGIAEEVQTRVPDIYGPIVIFCGLGNNGGDGLVAARHLAKNTTAKVQVVLLGEPVQIKSIIASENFYRLPRGVEIRIMTKPLVKTLKELDLGEAAVIIDSMLGIGITGTLKEPYSSIVKSINSSKASKPRQKTQKAKKGSGTVKAGSKNGSKDPAGANPLIISVDVPTGLGTNKKVEPDITVTFHDSKTGMTAKNSGEIIIHDIGIPKDAETFVGPGDLTFMPKVKSDSHKGDNGRLLVVGGGPFSGAPALVGLGALRTGIDLVHFAAPINVSDIIAGFSPNFIVHPLKESAEYFTTGDVKNVLGLLNTTAADGIVIGPGLGRNPETMEAVTQLINKIPKKIPLVLDADSLSVLSSKSRSGVTAKLLNGHTGILTPHKGEFNNLVKNNPDLVKIKGKQQKIEAPGFAPGLDKIAVSAKLFINNVDAKSNWALIMKGQIDIITDGSAVKYNRTGNPGMTVGGTGDVLAGIAGALLAKGLTPFQAARAAAFINGYSGDLAWEKLGFGLTATDIIEYIPQTIKYSQDI